jgi:glutamate-1-semialdehyde 2,1-aminomutase
MIALQALEAAIHAAWRARTPQSAAWHVRAQAALVGGVSGSVRFFQPYPAYFEGGRGSRVTDIDGHDYVDCFLCGACLLLGHRAPSLMEAISEAAARGSLILNPRHSTETAEMMQSLVPGAERVRFLNSGTEAVMSALRFARAFTGNPKIIKFLGTYHGMEDQMLVGLDGRANVLGAGIPPGAVEDIIMLRFGDEDALRAALAAGDVAAVLMDPSMHHGGLWVGDGSFHHAVRDMTRKAGVLLIFDEVIAGFRLAAGGGQQHFGVTADLAIFGKAFSAGEKLGAVTGRADVMGVADPSGRSRGPFAFQSGTGNDTTAAQLCAQAAMRDYARLEADGGYDRIAALARRLGDGLVASFAARGLALHANTLGPIVRIFLIDGMADYYRASVTNRKQLNLFHLALLTEGVLTIPGSNDFFLSFAHSAADIDAIIAAAACALDRFDFASAIERSAA